ncbi:hypothetical protein BaRGS_00019613 [Batillaria attramentaria]|uniref:G-protein coupled receptors family 1 profile domain-containing protein n=1 Tax=Batillaria attramentaria TaxID=370345 RepID=A0ABD0KPW4_9CAEN
MGSLTKRSGWFLFTALTHVWLICSFSNALEQTTLSFAEDRDSVNVTEVNSDNASSTTLTPLQSSEKPKLSMPQPSISQETYDRVMKIMNLFNLVFEAVSIVLTFTSASIYALPRMRCATAYYLVALNAADTLSGLLVVIRTTWQSTRGAAARSAAEYNYLTIFGSLFLAVSCRRMVYCLSAMVSMERFFVIAFPMKARYIKLIRYPKVCIAAMGVLVLAIHIYLPLKYQVSPSPSGVGYSMVYTDAFKANQEVFDDVANAARYVFSYFPLALCLVLSVALMMALKRHAASRQSLREVRDDGKGNDSDKAERQLAMTIWLSTLLFALLSLPSNTSQVVATYHSTFRFLGFEHRLYSLVGRFCYVALIATRYTNFLAYVCLSTSFRHNLIRLLCPEKVVRSLLVGRAKSGVQTNLASAGLSRTAISTVSSDKE